MDDFFRKRSKNKYMVFMMNAFIVIGIVFFIIGFMFLLK